MNGSMTEDGFEDVGDGNASSRGHAGARHMERTLHAEDFAERAAKIIHLKSVCKPSTFTGADQAWPEWKYKMENLFMLIGV